MPLGLSDPSPEPLLAPCWVGTACTSATSVGYREAHRWVGNCPGTPASFLTRVFTSAPWACWAVAWHLTDAVFSLFPQSPPGRRGMVSAGLLLSPPAPCGPFPTHQDPSMPPPPGSHHACSLVLVFSPGHRFPLLSLQSMSQPWPLRRRGQSIRWH